MRRSLLVALVALALSTSVASAQESQPESERVVAAFLAALDKHDIDRAAAFFLGDGQVIAPSSIVGREAITQWLPLRYPPDAVLEISTLASTGQRVSWMSRLSRGTSYYYPQHQLTWDEAVVVNGHITLWTSRALADTMTLAPQFRRANLLDPIPALNPDAHDADAPSTAPWLALFSGMAVAGIAGAALGVWRRPDTGLGQLHDGQRLLQLREHLRAHGVSIRSHG